MKVKLTKINRFSKDKEGNELRTKDGRPYTRLVFRCEEYGDKPISGFENAQTKSWKEGDEVEIEVEEKGQYLNFRVPKAEDRAGEKLEQILNQLVAHRILLETIKEAVVAKKRQVVTEDSYPTRESEGMSDEDPFADEPQF